MLTEIRLLPGATPKAREIFIRHLERTTREAKAKQALRRAEKRLKEEDKQKGVGNV